MLGKPLLALENWIGMANREEFELMSLSSIRIKLMPDVSPAQFDCTIEIDTGVFRGTIETVFFDFDLFNFKTRLGELQVPGIVTLGGNRGAEIRFEINKQIGGTQGSLAIAVSATPSGDDPWPKLSFLEFEVPAEFPKVTIEKLNELMAFSGSSG